MTNVFKTNSFYDNYDVFEDIGSGQFAIVRRCLDKQSGHEYAAKFIRKRRVTGSRRGLPVEDIQREVEILQRVKHDNIVQLHEVYDNGPEMVLILELVKGGELFDFISEKIKLEEKEAALFVEQILLGVAHLHEQGIVHLDLKPENILLSQEGSNNIKLIDFGLSRYLAPGVEVREIMGTAEFVAPEIIGFEPVCFATDLWSVGVITYNILSGESPFLGDDKQETFANISAVEYSFDKEMNIVSANGKDFISNLLIKNPKKRATAQECLEHPWISECFKDRDHFKSKKCLQLDSFPSKKNGLSSRWKRTLKAVQLCIYLQNSKNTGKKLSLTSGSGSSQSHYDSGSSAIRFNLKIRKNHSADYQDENFVVAALFCAIEEGNLPGLEELFSMSRVEANQTNRHGETVVHISAGLGQLEILKFLHSKGADLQRLDSHGDSAIYWAARQGQDQVIQYLRDNGVSVNIKNKASETALHVAARYGHASAVQLLCNLEADINAQDEHLETALHIAVWHGFPKIVHVLCVAGALTNVKNKEEDTPLHCAAARGHSESVRCLLDSGADPDLLDKHGCTALHLSLRRHHVAVAMLLLHSNCQVDIVDNHGEAPIHVASREGLLPLTQTLCAFGCKVDVPNKVGFYPLHLAAKNGHTEVARCLCLAGCNVDQKNRDGITAEVTALAQGYSNIADFLSRVKNGRDDFITQLIPSIQAIPRIKLKIFGHSGVGKTTLLDSLKTGYFSSWFRRSKTSTSPTSSINSNPEKPDVDPTLNESGLSFETVNENYTKGIDVQQVTISGVGDLSIWEFSGHEPYHIIYDHFIGNTNCLHVVAFRLSDPLDVQLQQVFFWLSFLQARIPPLEPLGNRGKSSKPAKVALVATHADMAGSSTNSATGDYANEAATAVLESVKERFQHIFDLHESVFVMDAHVVGSPAMKALKQYFGTCRHKVVQGLPKSTHFLDVVIGHLINWRKTSSTFPVLPWQQFIEQVQSQVNPLAGEDHMKELIQQLQLMGEVLYLKCGNQENQDVVVTNPKWLTVDVVGYLLSREHLKQARVTGRYTIDDMQLLFPDTDALDLLQVLESLHVCTQCDNDGEIEYEFPCFNQKESHEELWVKNLPYANAVYGGIRIRSLPGVHHMLGCLFSRLQVQLRRLAGDHPYPESDLYQWFQGSKFCRGIVEGLVTVVDNGEGVEVKVRGPADVQGDSFYLLEDLLCVIDQVLTESCPGLLVEKHLLSSSQLRQHLDNVVSYSPERVLRALLGEGPTAALQNNNNNREEKILDLVCCGTPDKLLIPRSPNGNTHSIGPNGLTLAPDLHISHLSLLTRQHLCALLDPAEAMGRDWCLLGVLLGMTDKLPRIDPGDNPTFSPMARVLEEWSKSPESTVGSLLRKLEELGRLDAVEVIFRTAPLLKVFPLEDEAISEDTGVAIDSHTSSSSLSR